MTRLQPAINAGLVILIGFCLTCLVLMPAAAHENQDNSDIALKKAVTYLSKQLGKTVSGQGYSYQVNTYPDSALGCPEPGVQYTLGPYQAYQFTIPYAGTNYDVRVSFDLTVTVLCTKIPTSTPVPTDTLPPTIGPSDTPAPTNTPLTPSETAIPPTSNGTATAPSTNTPPASNTPAVSATPSASAQAFLTFRNRDFSMAYPTTWQATDRLTDVFFGAGPSPVCAQPGMIVVSMGPLGSKDTADRLIDAYLHSTAAAGAVLQGDHTSVGSTGRSQVFVSPCTDGAIRESRVTVFVAYGNAYRVLQYSLQKDWDVWADVFLKLLDQFSPAAGSASAGGGSAMLPPSHTPLESLAHLFAGNVYVGALTDLPGVPITQDAIPGSTYRSQVISPDGKNIAFVDSTNDLLVASVKGGTPAQKIASKLAPGFPLAWNPDSSEIVYLADEGQNAGDKTIYGVEATKADGGATRKIGDTVGLSMNAAGCTAVSTDPSERLYWTATGPGGNGLVLAWAKGGEILYSLGCDGIGLGKIAQDGTGSAVLDAGLHRVQLSPDGSEALGIEGDISTNAGPHLVRLKLDDATQTNVTTAATPEVINPDQVAWSSDGGAIFYSTATDPQPITLNDPAQHDRGLRAFGTWPFQGTSYTLTLHRIDLTSGTDDSLYTRTGRAIVQIAPSADGSGVLFVLIQDSSNVVEAFKNNVSPGDLQREAPSPLLYWLPIPTTASQQAQLVAITLNPVWGPPGSAPAPTATGNPKKVQITPNVVIQATTPAPTATATAKK